MWNQNPVISPFFVIGQGDCSPTIHLIVPRQAGSGNPGSSRINHYERIPTIIAVGHDGRLEFPFNRHLSALHADPDLGPVHHRGKGSHSLV